MRTGVLKVLEILYYHLKMPGMGFGTFMSKYWKLTEITKEEYNDLLEENKKLKKELNKIRDFINNNLKFLIKE